MIDNFVLDRVFAQARTYSSFKSEPISDSTLEQLQQLAQWGPTAFNCQPARYAFVRSAESKLKLQACLSPGNVPKVASAPVTVIVAMDSRFHENLPIQFPHNLKLKENFEADPALGHVTAMRNSSLQAAYLIIAARLLGLDCGPMSGFDAAAVDACFFPDGRWRANLLVNLGYGEVTGLRSRGPRLSFNDCAILL
jgi:3-hydroxypropanoate dehydrogenase